VVIGKALCIELNGDLALVIIWEKDLVDYVMGLQRGVVTARV
jgi:hypothetical protein